MGWNPRKNERQRIEDEVALTSEEAQSAEGDGRTSPDVAASQREHVVASSRRGNPAGLIPVGVFLVLFIGTGVIYQDFYAMPAIVAFLIALAVAFLQNVRVSFKQKLETTAKSMGDPTVMIMCLVFVLAGAFSGAITVAGGVDSTVNCALSILPANIALAGLFLIACFISLAMGTSVGTIAALAPIAVGIAEKTGFAGALCLAAVVGGAMFGDNLSMISDTTIASTRTQGCHMKDKFKENFKIALPAAVLAFIAFLLIGLNSSFSVEGSLDYNFWLVVPYIFVLVSALCGMNVVLVLIIGTASALAIGLCLGTLDPSTMFTAMGGGLDGSGGITSMYDITVISLVVAGIIGLVKQNGGIDFILSSIDRHVKTKRGAEAGIAALVSFMDISTANNTIAIVMAGPIARQVAQKFDISPQRSASLLDVFASVWQGIIPYGAQILYASAGAAAVGLAVSPFELMPYLIYPYLLGICGVISIIVHQRRSTSGGAAESAVSKTRSKA